MKSRWLRRASRFAVVTCLFVVMTPLALAASPAPTTVIARAGHRVAISVTSGPGTCSISGSIIEAQSVELSGRSTVTFSWKLPSRLAQGNYPIILDCPSRSIMRLRAIGSGRTHVLVLPALVTVVVDPLATPTTLPPTTVPEPTTVANPVTTVPTPTAPSTEPACSYTLPLVPTAFNTTPSGPGPWTVPVDPCNTEGTGLSNIYSNCAYWGAEKRPDVWAKAVWIYGYNQAPGGAWNIELDAAEAGFPIDHTPQAGDLVVWPDSAVMGTDGSGSTWTASAGGHVAYVEAVDSATTITISEMGVDTDPVGGFTMVLTFNPATSYFVHK